MPDGTGNVIFWDFDGTLAHHPKWWSDLLADLLAAHAPSFPVMADRLRPHLQTGWRRMPPAGVKIGRCFA